MALKPIYRIIARYNPKCTKIGMASKGEPSTNQIKLFSGKYKYPSRIENDARRTDTRSTESTNSKTSFLLSRDKLISLFIKGQFVS